MTIIVTGAAGFIGSNFSLNWLTHTEEKVIALDKLTYAGNLENLQSAENNPNYLFIHGDIADAKLVAKILEEHQPRAIINFAAESHVDRSIHGPDDFIQTNIVGTFTLLEAAREYWQTLSPVKQKLFCFQHISTDEVFGDLLHPDDAPNQVLPSFTEQSPYAPSSPYSASKASSDHLVRAWQRTYGLPVIVTNCSNNYGPYQHVEKFIPLMIANALAGKALPVYGKGDQIRDWLYVEDHVKALYKVLTEGEVGETYNIGGNNEKRNIDVVFTICAMLEKLAPSTPYSLASGHVGGFRSLITYVADRPGHDRRYAIDASKMQQKLNWQPEETFESGMRKTVQWFLKSSS